MGSGKEKRIFMSNLQPNVVADNVVVSLHYILTVNGEMVDSTQGSAPLEYLQGFHNILPALERELTGMACGDSKQVLLPAREAYGEFNPDAFAEIEKGQFPPNFDFRLGRELRVQDDNGQVHLASIAEIKDEIVRLDLNHPLAGKDLLFKATIAGLRSPTQDELSHGRIGGCAGCSSSSCDSGDCH
jgi:FKBP-type peptidyl-prolyl cis-trans isomerase SlyD